MSNIQIKQYLDKPAVQSKFDELLGANKTNFTTSLMQVVSDNALLQKCEPKSIVNAAAMAAVLNLPINNSLGVAYIVPYKDQAQFQIGYKGLIQLAIRSGEYKTIASTEIYENQLASCNPLTGYEFDFSAPPKGEIVGYAAYFKLHNGFEKTLFMTVQEAKEHGKKFSKTYDKQWSTWKTNFGGMAKKTVIKGLLDKYGPKSIEMQKAILGDQSIVEDVENNQFTYSDNPETEKQVGNLDEKYDQHEEIDENEPLM